MYTPEEILGMVLNDSRSLAQDFAGLFVCFPQAPTVMLSIQTLLAVSIKGDTLGAGSDKISYSAGLPRNHVK